MSAPAALPTVSVVIATHNRADRVVRTVQQVLAQDHPHFEICVVDDGSTDDTRARLSTIDDPRLTVAPSPGTGGNASRNAGAAAATGDYLVFLDDDDAVRTGWLTALMTLAAETEADIVSCAVESVDRNWQNPIIETPRRLSPIFSGLEALFLGGAFAIRRTLFEEIEGYPEALSSNQQTGLALRVADRHDVRPVTTAITPFVGVIWHQRRRGSRAVPVSFARSRLTGTLQLLAEYPERYARDPRERSNYLSAAATCAVRLGDCSRARTLYWRAYRTGPARHKDLLRLLVAWVPPLARRVWPAIDDEPPAVRFSAPLRVMEVVRTLSGDAGVPIRARQEVAALRAAHHEIDVVVDEAPAPDSDAPVSASGAGAVTAVGLRRTGLRRSSINPLVLGWRSRRIVRERRPDVVVVHHPVTTWVVAGQARRVGAAIVSVVHSLVHEESARGANPHRRPTTAIGRLAERRLRRVEIVAPVGRALVDPLLRLRVPVDRVRAVPNAVDVDRFHPEPGPRDIDVLYVGRLSPEKGPQDLIAACAGLPASTRVTVVGSGRLREDLMRAAAGLACTVEFTGHLPAEELAPLYRRARVVTVPSHTESFGLVILEAFASGTPVVGTRVGGIPDLVRPGTTGWLVEVGDVTGLAAALGDALGTDDASMRASARAIALDHSVGRFNTRFDALVREAAGRR